MAIINDKDAANDKNRKIEEKDRLYEGEGNDDIYGGGADDVFNDDPLFGTAGSGQISDETIFGEQGSIRGGGNPSDFSYGDLDQGALVYNVTNHKAVEDFYDGDGAGKLVLQVTENQWQQSWLQKAIAEFEEFIHEARPGDVFDFSIYDKAGRYLQFKAANFQAVIVDLLTGKSEPSEEDDSVSDGDVAAQ